MRDPAWVPARRKPAAFRLIDVLTGDGREFSGLCYSTHEQQIIEPITGQHATPVIGRIEFWKYPV